MSDALYVAITDGCGLPVYVSEGLTEEQFRATVVARQKEGELPFRVSEETAKTLRDQMVELGRLPKPKQDSEKASQDVALTLRRSSWENLFECLYRAGTTINASGNFWAAIQYLNTQFDDFTGQRHSWLEHTES